MIDLVIRNATRHDGTGAAPTVGDLGVDGGQIVAVADTLPAGSGREEVDATGLVLAPGFIDLHTHSDVSLLSEPGCISAVEQGVTTQAVGLCGFSAGPLSPASLAGLIDEEPIFAFPGVDWTWTSIGGYRAAVEQARPATNVTTFIGHNTLRRFVIGSDDRA
nr:amidohydrolase family protein [Chloroflexota bacterium]